MAVEKTIKKGEEVLSRQKASGENKLPSDLIDVNLGEIYAGEDPLRDKVNEAKFFLKKMNEVKDYESVISFKQYFSAFIAASRSITFVLQKMFVDNAWFEEWYEKKRDELKKDFQMMIDIRNKTTKEGVFGIKRVNTVVIKKPFKKAEKLTFQLIKKDGKIFHRYLDETGKELILDEEITKKWFIKDEKELALLKYCDEYVSKLESIVEEAYNLKEMPKI